MSIATILGVLAVLAISGYFLGRWRSLSVVGGQFTRLHSMPAYHGWLVMILAFLPAFFVLTIWASLEGWLATQALISALPPEVLAQSEAAQSLVLTEIRNNVYGGIISRELPESLRPALETYAGFRATSRTLMTIAVLAIAGAGLGWSVLRITPGLRARNQVETVFKGVMIAAATIAILTTFGIFFSLIFESLNFFSRIPITDFLFGLSWSPQMAIRAEQAGASGAFGMIPLLTGTLLITFIAMCVSVPVGLFAAIYMSDYASPRVRGIAKPILEILAGIPTVVFGFFAALTVAPFFRDLGNAIGVDIASESALAAGVVMGVMIIPFVSSLSDDVMNAVPQTLRDGSYAMGATKSETIKRVVLPAALPGIVGAILLAVSRAIGETMIVAMAAGLAANLTANPLEAVTTITVQIVTLLVGDQEFDSAKTLSAFALGLLLFLVTLLLNVIALDTVRRYREKYD